MWKRAINRALRRLTGYQLQRVAPTSADATETLSRLNAQLEQTRDRLGRVRHRLKESNARLEQAQRRMERTQEKLERAKAMPSHYDRAAADIIRRVESRTMTDHAKLFGLVEATRYVVRRGIPGDFVECGVWRGGSMQAVALTLQEQGVHDRQLHLFDTFEGMPPPTEKDRRLNGTTAAEMLATRDKGHRVWAIAGLDDVEEAMREVAYPPENIHYHAGKVEETVPDRAPAQIALLRLDTDWYESTRHELEQLYDRVAPGGVLIIDDFGDWEGARLATEEFLETLPEPLLLLPIGTGRLAIKPPA